MGTLSIILVIFLVATSLFCLSQLMMWKHKAAHNKILLDAEYTYSSMLSDNNKILFTQLADLNNKMKKTYIFNQILYIESQPNGPINFMSVVYAENLFKAEEEFIKARKKFTNGQRIVKISNPSFRNVFKEVSGQNHEQNGCKAKQETPGCNGTPASLGDKG